MSASGPAKPREDAIRPSPSSRTAGEDRHKAQVDLLPGGIYRTTPDGRIIEANAMLARMLGFREPRALFSDNKKRQGDNP